VPRSAGVKNRNYPVSSLSQTLEIPQAIKEGASGKRIGKLALAKLVGRSPGASQFRTLILASRAYGLTKGGVNNDEFELTPLGHEATGSTAEGRQEALRTAVLNIAPYRTFLTAYDKSKVPADPAFREFLVKSAGVPEEWADDCIKHLLADARFVGLLDRHKNGEWVDLSGSTIPTPVDDLEDSAGIDDIEDDEIYGTIDDGEHTADTANGLSDGRRQELPPPPSSPKSVFVAHGKNRKPLEQLKEMLKEVGVPFEVAVDEAHKGRPVSEKVATMMRDKCSSAIFIFSADEEFFRRGEDDEMDEIWRPSENAVYELGAASVLYGRRIIIFKEDRVTLPSDFSDLGYISFHGDEIQSHWTELLRELKAHGIVEIRVAA
jgi:predicted nucleotide-binding protein